MRILRAFALTLLAACSATPPAAREPSSTPPSMESDSATLESVLGSADPRAEAAALVERLLRIRLRAQGWLAETDRLFAAATAPVNLFDQPSYRRLLVARALTERTKHKIVHFYREALAVSRGPAESRRGMAATAAVAGVHSVLDRARARPAERVLLEDLTRELAREGDAVVTALAPLGDAELAATAATAAPELKRMVDALPAADDVKEEVERAESDLAREPEPVTEDAAAVIFPTAAPAGNIDGFGFPRGTWALTFDDGPDPDITEKDVANLKAAGVKGTFFWLAKNLAPYTAIVKRVQAAGMSVQNHSWTHAALEEPATLARFHTDWHREIELSTDEDARVYGVKPRFFRCPYGQGFKNPAIRAMIARKGMVHVRWNVDSLDWQDRNPATVQARVEQQMRVNGRGIILFHDTHAPAVTVVPKLLARLRGQVRWVTIPQIVDELNGVPPNPPRPAPVPVPMPRPNPPAPAPAPQGPQPPRH